MKRILPLAISCLLFAANLSFAQNLVPNPSFEATNSCPMTSSTIAYSPNYTSFPSVQDWVNPILWSSPDYFNGCNQQVFSFGVPSNCVADQPAKTGQAYVGMFLWVTNNPNSCSYNPNEFVEARLLQPMIAGHEYLASFNANLSRYKWALDRVGMHFSDTAVYAPLASTLDNPMHIVNPGNYIDDTVNWELIQGVYTAAGGEQWVTIGRFCDGLPINPIAVNVNSLVSSCYIILDDVCVLDISDPANVQSFDTLLCTALPANITGRTIAGKYLWNTGATTASIGINAPGVYWRKTYAECAYYVDTIRVYSNNTQYNDTLICCDAFPVALPGQSTGATYLWSSGDTTPTIVVNDTGIYWRRSYLNCATTIDTFKVRYNPIKPDLGNDSSFCAGTIVALFTSGQYPSYQWSTGNNSPSIQVNASGQYVLTVSNSCGAKMDTVNITIKAPTPPPGVTDTLVCHGDPSPILAVDGTGILWYLSPGSNGQAGQPAINTEIPGVQTLYISQTIDGCESSMVPVTVEITNGPSFHLGNDTTLCLEQQYTLGQPDGNVTYLWNTGVTECCIRPDVTGTYILTESNICGSFSDSINITREKCDDCFFIPTAFTPNSDGKNDIFRPISNCNISSYSLLVVNRWGEVVFKTDNISNGWDGNYKSQPADVGTYQYLLYYQPDVPGIKKKMVKGDVTLIR